MYVDMVSSVIDMLTPNRPYNVILDNPPLDVKKELMDISVKKFTEEGKIEWFEIKSSSGDQMLQIHDFITGVVGDVLENKKDATTLYNNIKDKNILHVRRDFSGEYI